MLDRSPGIFSVRHDCRCRLGEKVPLIIFGLTGKRSRAPTSRPGRSIFRLTAKCWGRPARRSHRSPDRGGGTFLVGLQNTLPALAQIDDRGPLGPLDIQVPTPGRPVQFRRRWRRPVRRGDRRVHRRPVPSKIGRTGTGTTGPASRPLWLRRRTKRSGPILTVCARVRAMR